MQVHLQSDLVVAHYEEHWLPESFLREIRKLLTNRKAWLSVEVKYRSSVILPFISSWREFFWLSSSVEIFWRVHYSNKVVLRVMKKTRVLIYSKDGVWESYNLNLNCVYLALVQSIHPYTLYCVIAIQNIDLHKRYSSTNSWRPWQSTLNKEWSVSVHMDVWSQLSSIRSYSESERSPKKEAIT